MCNRSYIRCIVNVTEVDGISTQIGDEAIKSFVIRLNDFGEE